MYGLLFHREEKTPNKTTHPYPLDPQSTHIFGYLFRSTKYNI